MPEAWSVYVLRCLDGRLYTGIAIDPIARLKAHQKGRGAAFTRVNGVDELLGVRACSCQSAAMALERELKKATVAQKLDWTRQNPAVR